MNNAIIVRVVFDSPNWDAVITHCLLPANATIAKVIQYSVEKMKSQNKFSLLMLKTLSLNGRTAAIAASVDTDGDGNAVDLPMDAMIKDIFASSNSNSNNSNSSHSEKSQENRLYLHPAGETGTMLLAATYHERKKRTAIDNYNSFSAVYTNNNNNNNNNNSSNKNNNTNNNNISNNNNNNNNVIAKHSIYCCSLDHRVAVYGKLLVPRTQSENIYFYGYVFFHLVRYELKYDDVAKVDKAEYFGQPAMVISLTKVAAAANNNTEQIILNNFAFEQETDVSSTTALDLAITTLKEWCGSVIPKRRVKQQQQQQQNPIVNVNTNFNLLDNNQHQQQHQQQHQHQRQRRFTTMQNMESKYAPYPETTAALLCSLVHQRTFSKGETILDTSYMDLDEENSLYQVAKGSVKLTEISFSSDQEEIDKRIIIEDGQLFGLQLFFNNSSSNHNNNNNKNRSSHASNRRSRENSSSTSITTKDGKTAMNSNEKNDNSNTINNSNKKERNKLVTEYAIADSDDVCVYSISKSELEKTFLIDPQLSSFFFLNLATYLIETIKKNNLINNSLANFIHSNFKPVIQTMHHQIPSQSSHCNSFHAKSDESYSNTSYGRLPLITRVPNIKDSDLLFKEIVSFTLYEERQSKYFGSRRKNDHYNNGNNRKRNGKEKERVIENNNCAELKRKNISDNDNDGDNDNDRRNGNDDDNDDANFDDYGDDFDYDRDRSFGYGFGYESDENILHNHDDQNDDSEGNATEKRKTEKNDQNCSKIPLPLTFFGMLYISKSSLIFHSNCFGVVFNIMIPSASKFEFMMRKQTNTVEICLLRNDFSVEYKFEISCRNAFKVQELIDVLSDLQMEYDIASIHRHAYSSLPDYSLSDDFTVLWSPATRPIRHPTATVDSPITTPVIPNPSIALPIVTPISQQQQPQLLTSPSIIGNSLQQSEQNSSPTRMTSMHLKSIFENSNNNGNNTNAVNINNNNNNNNNNNDNNNNSNNNNNNNTNLSPPTRKKSIVVLPATLTQSLLSIILRNESLLAGIVANLCLRYEFQRKNKDIVCTWSNGNFHFVPDLVSKAELHGITIQDGCLFQILVGSLHITADVQVGENGKKEIFHICWLEKGEVFGESKFISKISSMYKTAGKKVKENEIEFEREEEKEREKEKLYDAGVELQFIADPQERLELLILPFSVVRKCNDIISPLPIFINIAMSLAFSKFWRMTML